MPEPPSDDEAAQLRAVVASVPWRFAKTLAYMPHEYIVRTAHPEAHAALSDGIKKHGKSAVWGKNRVRYLMLPPHRYWRTGPTVLNRALMTASELASGDPDNVPVPPTPDNPTPPQAA